MGQAQSAEAKIKPLTIAERPFYKLRCKGYNQNSLHEILIRYGTEEKYDLLDLEEERRKMAIYQYIKNTVSVSVEGWEKFTTEDFKKIDAIRYDGWDEFMIKTLIGRDPCVPKEEGKEARVLEHEKGRREEEKEEGKEDSKAQVESLEFMKKYFPDDLVTKLLEDSLLREVIRTPSGAERTEESEIVGNFEILNFMNKYYSNDPVTKLIEDRVLKPLNDAADIIKRNPMLQARVGKGSAGVMAVSEICKQAEKEHKARRDDKKKRNEERDVKRKVEEMVAFMREHAPDDIRVKELEEQVLNPQYTEEEIMDMMVKEKIE